jgi:hypothetical protein
MVVTRFARDLLCGKSIARNSFAGTVWFDGAVYDLPSLSQGYWVSGNQRRGGAQTDARVGSHPGSAAAVPGRLPGVSARRGAAAEVDDEAPSNPARWRF